jgi:hypothetical protein
MLSTYQKVQFFTLIGRNGIPCVWFGGPSENRLAIALYADICTEMGIRLTAFDRPGRGASTPLRNPKEWTFDSWAGMRKLLIS